MRNRIWLATGLCVVSPGVVAGAVLGSLQPFLINHYTFDNPQNGDPLSPVELDLGADATSIQLLNAAPRIVDGAWWGSHYALETGQKNSSANDDWKAGVMFSSSAASTLAGTEHATGVTVMGWFKPLGTVSDNPSPNTNTPEPDDFYNAFGLAGFLRGDENMSGLDGHSVRALLEVINGKITGLGRRLDNQTGSGQRTSADDWYVVMPPGTWTHLAAAFNFDSGSIRLYQNGQPLASSSTSTGNWQTTSGTDYTSNTNAGGIKIAGSYPDNSQERNPFNGRIDELMFFNKFLSDAEMAAQFQLISNIPGDFNLDGAVDAADYTVWRDGLGSSYTASDYDVWKSHFGAAAPENGGSAAAVSSSAAVPEPNGILLLLVAFPVVFRRFPEQRRPRR